MLNFFDRFQEPGWYLTDYQKLSASKGPAKTTQLNDYGVPQDIEYWPFKGRVYPRLGEIEKGETLKKPNWADPRWDIYQSAPEKCAVRLLPMMSLDFWGGKDSQFHIDARDMYHKTSVSTGAPEYIDELIYNFQAAYDTQETVIKESDDTEKSEKVKSKSKR